MTPETAVFWGLITIVAVLAAMFVGKGIRIVPQARSVVIERLGSYHRTLEPGINFIIPWVDQPRRIRMRRYDLNQQPIFKDEQLVDRRESVMDFPPQSMITADNVSVATNGAIYYQIIDPKSAIYQIEDFANAIEVLAKTTLRSQVGQMELDRVFESRDEINRTLATVMDEAGNKWGVKINRVEIQEIQIPEVVEEAMRKQMTAERERRATVTEAEGHREAEIRKAEGDKRAQIERAEGDKQAQVLRAQGEQEAINTIMEAAGGNLQGEQVIQYLIALQYMRTLPDIARNGERVFLPYEATQLMGSIGSIQELLRGDGLARG